MALSAALLQAIAEGRPLATVVTITLPASAGGDLQLSDRPVVDASLGAFEPRITSFSKVTRRLSGPDGTLDTPTLTLTVTDIGTEDEPVWRLGRIGRRLEGAPVVVRWAAEGVAPADWSTRFTGYVVSKRAGSERNTHQVTCRVDDRWLSRPIGPRLTADVWPTAETQAEGSSGETVLGRRAPVAYGTSDSTGLGSHGLRRLLFIQTAGSPWRWLYSVGDCAVGAVFIDGAPVATGWTRVVEFRGGWWWTTVDFADDPRPDDGQGGKKAIVVTVDGDGLDVGTFGADTSPAAQLRHAVEAFGRPWDGGAAPTEQLTDDASWDALEAYCAAGGDEGAGVLGGQAQTTTLRDLLRDMLRGWGWAAYWTREGKLAVLPEQWARDVAPPTPGTSTWLAEGELLIEPLALQEEDAEHRTPGLRLRYCPGPDGQPLLEVAAMDPLKLDEEPEEINLPLGPQRVV